MLIHDLEQGSQEWHDLRFRTFTASEAPAMMGEGYMTRTELLNLKKNMTPKEAGPFLQGLFDRGHDVERKALPIVEEAIERSLYPMVGSVEVGDMTFLASFDGLTMDFDVGFENKLYNDDVIRMIVENTLSGKYYWQLEHQLLVSGAKKIYFTCSDGTDENTFHLIYFSNPERRAKLIAGWEQFKVDLEDHEVKPEYIKPEAKPIMELPALAVIIKGTVQQSNLAIYQSTALQFINDINTDLRTDQNFADAEATIKFCDKAEKELMLAKKQAISQTSDIETLFRTIDSLSDALRSKRLILTKLVKTEKENRKIELINKGRAAIDSYVGSMYSNLQGIVAHYPDKILFPAVLKGKRTIDSMENAIDTEIARQKIEINQICMLIESNIKVLKTVEPVHKGLFVDINDIVRYEPDYFQMIVNKRVSEYEEAEKTRLFAEREVIRKQEEEKALKLAEQERAKIRQQEELRAQSKHDQEIESVEATAIQNEQERSQVNQDQEIIDQNAINAEISEAFVDEESDFYPEPVHEKLYSIPLSEYTMLIEKSTKMDALLDSGVENWEGFNEAMVLFQEYMQANAEQT
ncbi:MAG: hypothetical protein GQ468_05275 [Candidatus Scalindua sp.]|nr:hypothetical protein [Candidatus Scalindua sp.]